MTRKSLNRTLRRVYILLGLVLVISLTTKIGDHLPWIKNSPYAQLCKDIYEYLKDMALVLVTVVAAYLANVFQKRSKFVESLEKEWRSIVATKSVLFTYCAKTYPTTDEFVAAFCRISETLDNMRIVYRNVGETGELVGLYPYAPLHDMRRALQSIDPRKTSLISEEQRTLARHAILQSFYALRETFLEELDLQEPDHPLLIMGARRTKTKGALARAERAQGRQRQHNGRGSQADPEIDAFLHQLYDKENSTAKPYRPGAAPAAAAAAGVAAPR
jgi:hypothetical protein